jgi:hypothetical protein
MDSGDRPVGEIPDQRVVQQIDVEMQNVKFARTAPYLFQQDEMIGNTVLDCRIEPQRHGGAADEFGSRPGIAAGEQGRDRLVMRDWPRSRSIRAFESPIFFMKSPMPWAFVYHVFARPKKPRRREPTGQIGTGYLPDDEIEEDTPTEGKA